MNAIGWGTSQTLWSAAAILFAMLSLGYFLNLTVPFIAYGSLCCADDGFFAMSARLLAKRGIYGLPVSNEEISLFEPTIGSGPAFIFPGAWMIRGFGPKVPVPAVGYVLLGISWAGYSCLDQAFRRRGGVAAYWAS